MNKHIKYLKMKKIIVTTLCLALVYACNPPADTNPAPAATSIGYQVSKSGEKIPLYGGDMAAVSLWETYLKAHNEQDLETIAALNADKDFVAYGPKGEVIKGTEAHMEFLTAWFEQAKPKWTTKYLITNMYTDSEGNIQQWITSGHDLTLTVDGKEVKLNQVHDGLVVDGKVKMFTVNERVLAPEPEQE